ncbi:MAG: hypothetical protein ACXVLX_17665 [Ilumatobacteraceae bacterium]
MGDTIKFPASGGVSPTFAGRGSKIEHADILPIFWGPSWLGSDGQAATHAITVALRAMTAGAFLNGVKQPTTSAAGCLSHCGRPGRA